MNYADRIKELRKENGFTQLTLSKALGVSKGTVAMWETAKRTPDYEPLHTMSKMFDRSMDYILGYSDDDTPPRIAEEHAKGNKNWVIQGPEIDIFRQYLRLDTYGKMSVNALIAREAIRCQEQGTEQDISDITVGLLTTNDNSESAD